MVKTAVQFFIVSFVLCFASVANASILLEPYVGYATGNSKGGTQTNTTSSYSVSGMQYGGRLGVKHMGLMVGGEYQAGSLTIKDTGANIGVKDQNVGAFLGYQVPMMGLRFYGTYFFSAAGTLDSTPQVKLGKGSGYKAGLGLNALPYIAVNLEYMHTEYLQASLSGITADLSPKEQIDIFMLTLSFPLTFP